MSDIQISKFPPLYRPIIGSPGVCGEGLNFASRYGMSRNSKQILQFAGGMMLAALVAFLLHPLLWVLIRCGFDWGFLWVAAVCVLVYGAVGAFARWKYWHLSWKELAFRVWAIITAILFIILMVYIYWPRYIDYGEGIGEQHIMDGMTALLFFSTSAFAAAFSAIPIGYCCYLFKRQTGK